MDSEIIAYARPPVASDMEAAEGAPSIGEVDGRIAHLREIRQCLGNLRKPPIHCGMTSSQPKRSRQDRRHSPPHNHFHRVAPRYRQQLDRRLDPSERERFESQSDSTENTTCEPYAVSRSRTIH